MWREFVRQFVPEHQFFSAVTIEAIASASNEIGVELPDELQNLLLETNGVFGSYELGLVWPIERIVEDNGAFRSNIHFRELYMPFDSLLFFADAGNGDQFAYSIVGGRVRRTDIFVWNHEDDSRVWVAPSLGKYLEWTATGKIKL